MAGRPINASLRKAMNKAIVKHTDMSAEMTAEVLETISSSIDKFNGAGVNIENAARLIKETLDKAYGFNWHCAIGKGFSFDVTAQNGTLLYAFFQAELAILVFKC
mmetsp:Transcript_32254/g.48658  ORF Transcript_32254/g.48658 Transcript_32254/m.48658 type:complete len:105 (-) Transcript_32254:52-366(-)|eukprot:CAMPEP_0206447156 /NCGR_PEP_ID=MMETSP0324_2-20121206/16604_1 /ASSEMBLY_ACC=CAM_ASM_000836 /TAXON_ID=2866 /ORGANISM="Crypthecodinium cohnii, Strain Seligo" /LENGTH=104 /DNA_ID=CAMNT_0053915845 /DNA_START=235 /DNA_END=549 /DNA_ORIENTATION=+